MGPGGGGGGGGVVFVVENLSGACLPSTMDTYSRGLFLVYAWKRRQLEGCVGRRTGLVSCRMRFAVWLFGKEYFYVAYFLASL